MRALLARVIALFRRRQLDAELSDEISAHLEFAAADHVERGLSAAEAHRAASRRFGGVRQTEEAYREHQGFPLAESLWQDIGYGLRNLRRQPVFTAVVLTILATVIGLNTSLFTLTAGLIFRPWSGVSEPSRVVAVYPVDSRGRASGFSVAGYRYLSAHAGTIGGLAMMRPEIVDLGTDGALGKTGGFLVSGNFFDVLGVAMARGRGFRSDEDRPGSPAAVAVLGYSLWQSRFGGDAGIVGSELRVNGAPFTVVGIAPASFVGPQPGSANLFLPITTVPLLHPNDPAALRMLNQPDDCCADVVGRLAPGATRVQAAAELEVLSRSFGQQFVSRQTETGPGSWHLVVTGTEFLSRPGRKTQILALMALLSAGLLLVWLLACANVGNLQLARAASRGREIGIRLSLGASRQRVVRQLVTEGLILALVAGALGIAAASVLPRLILQVAGGGSAAPFSLAPDGVVLAFAIALAAASSLVFGLAPALHATRVEVAHVLKTHGAPGQSSVGLRMRLLGVQVATSVVLLVAAALLVRAAQRRTGSFDPGFSADDVTVVSLELPATYSPAQFDTLLADLTQGLRASPHRLFAFTSIEPLATLRQVTHIRLPGTTEARPDQVWYFETSQQYFDLLRIPLVAGRGFAQSEAETSVVINETLARENWPNENPVGKTFFVAGPGGFVSREVVGVVRNAYTAGFNQVPQTLYAPLGHAVRFPKLLLRDSGTSTLADVTLAVRRLDPRVRVRAISLADAVNQQLAASRYGPILATVLGSFALTLAAVGTFGVFAYVVRQRTREIGVRIALGASRSSVIRLILFGQSRALLWGVGIGALGAVPTAMLLRGFLYGLSPFDPMALAGVAAALTIAGLAASYLPARRATRIDPVAALRED